MGDDFNQFLKENKIDASSLEGTGLKEKVFNTHEQRMKDVLRTRLDAFPYSPQVNYRMQADIIGHMAEELHTECYDICAFDTQLPLLSMPEGKCFRNCITKFSVFYPTLQNNIQHSAASFYFDKYTEESLKKHPNLKPFFADSFSKERNTFFEKLQSPAL